MNERAVYSPDARDIPTCVTCGRRLKEDRPHVDTCGERCFSKLLRIQREDMRREAEEVSK